MIITRLRDGMGNQMFQYAIGRALSIKYNTSLGINIESLLDSSYNISHTFRDYNLDVFNIKAEIIDGSKVPFTHKYYNKEPVSFGIRVARFILKNLLRVQLKGKEKKFDLGFNSSIFSLGPNAFLDGYWQSEKYFIDIADIIRKDFTPNNEPPLIVKNLMEVIEKENSICIHVRSGDYVGNKDFEVVNKEYYDKAINYVNSKNKIDKIYIFSDDIKWCEDNMSFPFPTMFVGDEYKGVKNEWHHILMRSCKNFIIPNSTYSWWAAWLAPYDNKIVIAPKKWFPDASVNKNYQDIVPEKWIKI